ncbi:MAG: DUF559 domain-containing protein [Candidatus Aminicenantes bacterium]|nr:DUF559 domain-containing protein [Candidatus Aminicenantes bacterium]
MPYRSRCKPEKLAFAKKLRRNPSRAEAILWSYLRNKQLGFHFRRREVILGWIVGFYCAKAKIAIQVDGPSHDMLMKEYDYYRDRQMWEKGILTLRVDNKSAEKTPEAVAEWIKYHVINRLQQNPSSPKIQSVYAGQFKRSTVSFF